MSLIFECSRFFFYVAAVTNPCVAGRKVVYNPETPSGAIDVP